jgi:predicted PurR-regulated permease PerM
MMHARHHVTFWLITLFVLAALVWLLSDVLLPFVAGIALAYLLSPVADRMVRLGINRTVAALLLVTGIVVTLIAVVVLVVPLLVHQGAAFIASIPGHFKRIQELIADPSLPWLNWLDFGDKGKTMSDFAGQASTWLMNFAYSLWTGGRALVSAASVLVVMPVVTFYIICDWHGMIEVVDGWVPVRQREIVRTLAREIDAAISGFMRGQLGVCLVLGCYYAIGLTLVGLHFGLLIGLIAGLLTFVPYIGSMTGLLIATSVALAQFWPDWKSIVAVVAIFLVGQFIEGNILSPKFVGERVGLHPVWMIFAMFAFGYLFGFVGLLLAVPLAAAVAVLFRFGMRQYLASPFYTGEKPT